MKAGKTVFLVDNMPHEFLKKAEIPPAPPVEEESEVLPEHMEE
jgi:hypothetical protein